MRGVGDQPPESASCRKARPRTIGPVSSSGMVCRVSELSRPAGSSAPTKLLPRRTRQADRQGATAPRVVDGPRTTTRSSRWRATPGWGSRSRSLLGRSPRRFIAAFRVLPCMRARHRPAAESLGLATAVGSPPRSRRLMLAARHPPAPGPRSDPPGTADRQLLEVAAWRVCREVVEHAPSWRSTPPGMFGRRRASSSIATRVSEGRRHHFVDRYPRCRVDRVICAR